MTIKSAMEHKKRRKVTRPEHLPDFANPPLNEVVLGVQFAPSRTFQRIFSYEVWQLFKQTFPNVQEHPPLMPTFETFGLPTGPQFNFGFGPEPSRFWFLSPNQDELIQFQNDKLLHNWRKIGDQTNEYPRFEKMIVAVETEMNALEGYFLSSSRQKLEINQCEISYINHIYLEDGTHILTPSEILRFANFGERQPDDISISFRTTIYDDSQRPIGRITCEAQTAINNLDQRQMISLTITARGAPKGTSIADALSFLKLGREMVVKTFAEVTTDLCHERWGRTQ